MKVTVVIPSLNEEECVEAVIRDIGAHLGNCTEIIVIDSGTDRTAEIAEELGARVLRVAAIGTGHSLLAGFRAATGDVIITTDCDDTYPMSDAPKLLDQIEAGSDVVSATRMHERSANMPLLNYCGNWLFALMARLLYRIRTSDITTGMRAYRRQVLEGIAWRGNFDLPAELVLRLARRGFGYAEVPITYRPRAGGKVKLRYRMGLAIVRCILKWRLCR